MGMQDRLERPSLIFGYHSGAVSFAAALTIRGFPAVAKPLRARRSWKRWEIPYGFFVR